MAIIQNLTETPGDGSYVFPTALTTLRTEGRYLAPSVTHVFPGVRGVKQYLDNAKSRPIVAEVHLYDRASEQALLNDLLGIESRTHVLTGILDIEGTIYPPSTFMGIEYLGPVRWDPHHLWRRKCRLHWLQRRTP